MKKFKRKWMLTIISSALILTIGGLVFIQIQKNHQENQQVIEECFENFESEVTVVVEKENLLSRATCEK